MHAPLRPRVLGARVGAELVRGQVGRLVDRRLAGGAPAVDDRVARDRVQPRGADASLGPVGARRPPDRRKRVLHRILRSSRVAEPAQGQAEDRARVAAVEQLERRLIAFAGALDELRVGDDSDVPSGGHRRRS
jgi:hypothetical protein